jgi:hypothetical protein
MERRCGSCHGSEPCSNQRIGKGLFYQFGPAGPPLPLVHSFADLKQIRAKIGYFKFGRGRTPQSLCNLTRPASSLLLRAPLSTEADGLELCSPTVFQSANDPDYQAILRAITEASERHQIAKRFDMPGFRPNSHYIQQMRRFGILPANPAQEDAIDVYAIDQKYWQSFWHPGVGKDDE